MTENEASGSVGGLSPSRTVQSTRAARERTGTHVQVCAHSPLVHPEKGQDTSLGHSWSSVQTEAAPFTCLRGYLLSDSILYKWELCVHVCPLT